MAASAKPFDRDDRPREDHIVILRGTWADYQRLMDEERTTSDALPGLDLVELASFVDRPTTSAAIRAYRDALQAKR